MLILLQISQKPQNHDGKDPVLIQLQISQKPHYLKTSKLQYLKTSMSQNPNVSKPQYLKTSIPQCHDDPVSDLLHDNQSILITSNPITESQITIISFFFYNSSINKIHPTMQFPEIF